MMAFFNFHWMEPVDAVLCVLCVLLAILALLYGADVVMQWLERREQKRAEAEREARWRNRMDEMERRWNGRRNWRAGNN